jgi:hypothetical protein
MGQENHETVWTCPCEAGTVTQQTTSYDNGYSADDHSYSVQCGECAGGYQFRYTLYVGRGSVVTAVQHGTGIARELKRENRSDPSVRR